jgi:hypothetical protein
MYSPGYETSYLGLQFHTQIGNVVPGFTYTYFLFSFFEYMYAIPHPSSFVPRYDHALFTFNELGMSFHSQVGNFLSGFKLVVRN